MKVDFYHQHTPETCGIACMYMVLDAFGLDFPTIAKEHRAYARYKSRIQLDDPRASLGTPSAAVAYALARRPELDVTLIHASSNLIENHGGYYPPDLHAQILAEHKDYIALAHALDPDGHSFHMLSGIPITPAFLRSELVQDHLVIVELLIPSHADGMHDHTLHGVLLYGMDQDGNFLVCDPDFGRRKFSAQQLAALMDTPVGSLAISVGKRAGT